MFELHFWRTWFRSFVPFCLAIVAFAGSLASIVALFGSIDKTIVLSIVLVTIFAVLFAAFYTKPKPLVSAVTAVGKRLDVRDLSIFNDLETRVGLIGLQNAGKSTFVETITSKRYSKTDTSAHYAIIYCNTTLQQPKYIALIDSVGKFNANQFTVSNLSNVIVVFIDHSNSDSSSTIDVDRSLLHLKFVEQIVYSIVHADIQLIKTIVVVNKYDLWKENNSEIWSNFCGLIVSKFREHKNFGTVSCFYEYSNFDHNKVVSLSENLILHGDDQA